MSDDKRIKELQIQASKLAESIQRLIGTETVLFSSFVTRYLEEKMDRPTLRLSTKKSFKAVVTHHVLPHFGPLTIDKVNNSAFLTWVKNNQRSETPLSSFFNVRKSLVELLNAAKEEGLIDRVPKFDNPDVPKDTGRTMTENEVLSLIWHSKRQYRVFFYALWKTGCRPKEVLQWRWFLFEFNEPGHTWITIRPEMSKNGRLRKIPLNKELSRLLYLMSLKHKRKDHYVFPHPGSPIFPNLSYMPAWNRASKRAGIVAKPYDLRRTFITRCAAEGEPMIFVAKLLDTSVKMVESVYAKIDTTIMEKIVT